MWLYTFCLGDDLYLLQNIRYKIITGGDYLWPWGSTFNHLLWYEWHCTYMSDLLLQYVINSSVHWHKSIWLRQLHFRPLHKLLSCAGDVMCGQTSVKQQCLGGRAAALSSLQHIRPIAIIACRLLSTATCTKLNANWSHEQGGQRKQGRDSAIVWNVSER